MKRLAAIADVAACPTTRCAGAPCAPSEEMTERQPIVLSDDEIVEITGGYTQPARQIEELHRQGFVRARRGAASGRVIVERAHYEAVCAGIYGKAESSPPRQGYVPRILREAQAEATRATAAPPGSSTASSTRP